MKIKVVSVTIYKRTPNVKNYIIRWSDNSVSVRTLFLSDEICDHDKLLCRKFKKSLSERIYHRMSYKTMCAIMSILNSPIDTDYFERGVLKEIQ